MPRAMITKNSGVASRLPFWTLNSLVPSYSLVAGKRDSTNFMKRFSSYSSSSLSPSRMSFHAV